MELLRIFVVVVSLLCAQCVATDPYKVNTEGCSVTKTCQFFPSSCTAGDSECETNKRIITWKKAAESTTAIPLIEIEMRSSPNAGYIAFGFGRNNIMKDADVYYCTSSNAFATAAIRERHETLQQTPLENGVESTAASLVENAINCRFQRTMAVSKASTTGEYSYDITKESFHLLVAEGPTNPNNNDEIGHHSWKTVTNDKINFTAEFPLDTPPTTNAPPVPDVSPTQTTTLSTTKTETPTTTNQKPTTSQPAPPQTTSSSSAPIQSFFWVACAILVSTMLSGWKC